MLLLFGHGEVFEDHEEDEQVIHAEGDFQNIPSDELQRNLVSLPEVQQNREPGGQRDVHRAPAQGCAKTDNPAATMNTKIQQQHAERENVEENPEVEQWEVLEALGN
jgi:hypothetical protein